MDTHAARQYLEANFQPDDRLAIVALHKATGDVKQRIASTDRIVQEDLQRWLRFLNARSYEIYVSMNTIHEGARGRKKSDVAEIRHVYLDFDRNGAEAVRHMMAYPAMPQPNHLIESSPGKWQTIWRVHGFELPQAEDLLRRMVREFGADPAAVDSARVLRLPGFYNHKYDRPHLVTVETLSSNVYTPAQFPHFTLTETVEQSPGSPRTRRPHSAITQSERDWAFAKRALGRGDDPQDIIQSIAAYRTDKPNPQYYAQHTVEKARAAIEQERRAAVQKTTSPGKPREGLSFGLG